ncbi:MAG: SPOR domain-containing protein [Terriglobales bacterium]
MKPAAQRYERETPKNTHRPQSQFEMGTRSLFVAFLALAVVCGLFFAFGYTVGKHAIPATFSLGAAPAPAVQPQVKSTPPGVQPPNPQQLGAAETNQIPTTLTSPPAQAAAASQTAAAPATTVSNPPSPSPPATTPAASTTSAVADVAQPSTPAAAPRTTSVPANASASQLFEVQVFAGTSGDANALSSALQTRGYPSSVITPASGSGSNLYRVEVGPYLTRAEAQAMRARLRADGYQAVLRIGQ